MFVLDKRNTAWLHDTLRQTSLGKSVAGADLRSLRPLTSLGTSAWPYRVTTQYSYFMLESTILHHCFRSWLGADQATSHYLNQWWVVYKRIYASLGLNQLTCPTCSCFTGIQETWTTFARHRRKLCFAISFVAVFLTISYFYPVHCAKLTLIQPTWSAYPYHLVFLYKWYPYSLVLLIWYPYALVSLYMVIQPIVLGVALLWAAMDSALSQGPLLWHHNEMTIIVSRNTRGYERDTQQRLDNANARRLQTLNQ